MQETQLKDLVMKLRKFHCEFQTVEVKYEIYTYEAYRRRIRDDIRPVDDADMGQLRTDLLADYLRRVKADRAFSR